MMRVKIYQKIQMWMIEIGDDGGEQIREMYATKSKRPPPKPNKSNLVFPYIEKEMFDALPEEVKLKINQQHAYY